MKNKKQAIWLFSGGPMQEHIAKKIVELNYKLILTDINKECVCAKYADEFIHADTFNFSANLDALENLEKNYNIKAVITVAADCHETVALMSRHLSLPGIDPKISHICRHKNLTREVLSAAGVPQPKFCLTKNINEAKSFLKSIGNQGVVKSTDNSGSRGFTKINPHEELTESVFKKALESGTTGAVLIEETLFPIKDAIAELSVETLWFNGKMYWLNWVDRLFRSDLNFFPSIEIKETLPLGWGVEVGHLNPARHSLETKNTISNMIFEAGKAIGLHSEKGGHFLKADMMLTDRGPIIIEITPRLSGGWDSSATTLARGADFQSGAIFLAMGKDLDLDLWYKYFDYKATQLNASIWAEVPVGADNNIGRKFSLGVNFNREKSLEIAFNNSKEKKYVV